MIVYLDSSAVLRVLLRQPGVLDVWGRWERAYSSELLHVEACRVIDRLRLEGALDDAAVGDARETLARIEDGLGVIPVTRAILQRAALPMATVVRTLDAIHLASALLLRERRDVVPLFATHDPQQMRGARALGFDCVGL